VFYEMRALRDGAARLGLPLATGRLAQLESRMQALQVSRPCRNVSAHKEALLKKPASESRMRSD
jgi:hypothetical protein